MTESIWDKISSEINGLSDEDEQLQIVNSATRNEIQIPSYMK